MNCPACSSAMLFGATACPCGYNASVSRDGELPIDLSYWEGLRAYWRVYWPTQAVGAVLVFLYMMISWRTTSPLAVVLSMGVGAAALLLFVPRICSRPYRGFSLVVVEVATGGTTRKLRTRWRLQVWLFLWWRQILAGMLATLLSMPLNALLILFGLQLAQWIGVFAGVLVIGPILLKMLIGHQFEDFRIEARREPTQGALVEATQAPGPSGM